MEPPRGARPQGAGGIHLWVAGCAAEALPVAETAEAEQGQRSAFCEGAATPEAKAGHRNPGGLDINNAGAGLSASPRRGTLSFVTQSSFVLVRSTTEGTLVRHSFLLLFAVTSDGCLPGPIGGLRAYRPLTSNTAWCSVSVISTAYYFVCSAEVRAMVQTTT